MGGRRAAGENFWNEERWKEALCNRKKKHLSWWCINAWCTKETKKLRGWSTEEMKDKASSPSREDTEEMRTWRDLNQEEMDQCWKKLAERMEEEVLDKYKSRGQPKRGLQRQSLLELRHVRRSNKYKTRKW